MPVENETGQKRRTVKPDNRPAEVGRVSVTSLYKDERKALLDKLDEANPEFIHSYESPYLTPEEIALKGKEIVEENGSVLRHQTDPVVRQPRETVMARRILEEEVSYQALKDVTETERDPRVFRQPKKPGQK